MLLKTGAIYTLTYLRWRTNFKIYAFILFGNPIIPKVHALNLGAKQLTIIERARLIHVIVQLSKIPDINKYTGKMLYRILLTYCKKEIRKCYRTYFHQYITSASILNYGIRKKEEFDAEDYKVYNKFMYEQAKKDYIIRILNLYSRRGLDIKHLQNTLAKIHIPIPEEKSSAQQIQPQQQPKLATPKKPAKETKQAQETKSTTEQKQQTQIKSSKSSKSSTSNDEFGNMGY